MNNQQLLPKLNASATHKHQNTSIPLHNTNKTNNKTLLPNQKSPLDYIIKNDYHANNAMPTLLMLLFVVVGVYFWKFGAKILLKRARRRGQKLMVESDEKLYDAHEIEVGNNNIHTHHHHQHRPYQQPPDSSSSSNTNSTKSNLAQQQFQENRRLQIVLNDPQNASNTAHEEDPTMLEVHDNESKLSLKQLLKIKLHHKRENSDSSVSFSSIDSIQMQQHDAKHTDNDFDEGIAGIPVHHNGGTQITSA